MRMTRQSIGTIALAVAAALFGSGCPALIIPGLAYQGYKYEHDKNEAAAKTPDTQSSKSTTSPQQKTPNSADIE